MVKSNLTKFSLASSVVTLLGGNSDSKKIKGYID